MKFSDNSTFWVIFDTCTRPEYYQDVHNLLAYPTGSTMRYEYRERDISGRSLRVLEENKSGPEKILFIYHQWRGHQRGNQFPKEPIPQADLIWVPTRLGEMVLIPEKSGETYYFDFKIEGYPAIDVDALSRIIRRLHGRQETPRWSWVSISDAVNELHTLQQGNDEEKWQAIVDELGNPPIQFQGDTFWRVDLVSRGGSGKTVHPRHRIEGEKLAAEYTVFQNDILSFRYTSHSPVGTLGGQRRLDLSIADNSPLVAVSQTSVELRAHTKDNMQLKGLSSLDPRSKQVLIKVLTQPRNGDWPAGPALTILISVKKLWIETVFGSLFILIGVLPIILVDQLWDMNNLLTVFMVFLGLISSFIGYFILKGKLQEKPS